MIKYLKFDPIIMKIDILIQRDANIIDSRCSLHTNPWFLDRITSKLSL